MTDTNDCEGYGKYATYGKYGSPGYASYGSYKPQAYATYGKYPRESEVEAPAE
jgi:hypothetical protein